MVTVTFVEVAADLRQAKVHVSIMGSDTQQRLSLQGLKSAAGFLQSKVADRIDTRYTPRLEFVLDMGVKKSLEIARILREVLPKDEATAPADEAGASAGDEPADASTDDETAESGDDESPGPASAESASTPVPRPGGP
jgi:ribosome-binding factor A